MFNSNSEFIDVNNTQAELEKLNRLKWRAQLNFEAYGTRIGMRSNTIDTIENVEKMLSNILPTGWNEIDGSVLDFIFSIIVQKRKSKKNVFYKNGELILENFSPKDILQIVDSYIRMTVGEHSKDYVFLHAGVVGWKGKAIVIPGSSFSGKTTLVAEFVRRGALYYSDDFTVLDKNGYVHPFPRKLSLRGIIDDYRQLDFAVEELGGMRGTEPIPVGIVLLTKYKKKAKPKLKEVSSGEGMMAGLENSLSVRQNPARVLKVLRKALNKARIYKSPRNEAGEFVDICFDFFEKTDLEIG